MLTEVLLSVTNEEIENVCKSVYNKYKKQELAGISSIMTLTSDCYTCSNNLLLSADTVTQLTLVVSQADDLSYRVKLTLCHLDWFWIFANKIGQKTEGRVSLTTQMQNAVSHMIECCKDGTSAY